MSDFPTLASRRADEQAVREAVAGFTNWSLTRDEQGQFEFRAEHVVAGGASPRTARRFVRVRLTPAGDFTMQRGFRESPSSARTARAETDADRLECRAFAAVAVERIAQQANETAALLAAATAALHHQ
ncbi:hypothetical protein [Caballeronia novacaledonica]|uniref:Uncharacterized protein n=1 Tax=Caballeronia novacaledonica TaxID=1544861 RepID=A0AA37IE00_9BURK|nr:hypothetical protein [Caballeronia novacaledonica]GJH28146.1 hypothetical protein CBA19CS42_26540 [Caballeronia novacaledonica]